MAKLLREHDLLSKLLPTEPSDRAERDRVLTCDALELSGGQPIVDERHLALARGGLLYAVDALEAAHVFFQEDAGDLAAYWHGMLHRREGDFDNARYWFRRAGKLPFFSGLHSAAAAHSAVMARQSNWDPYLFTGECEQVKFGAENVVEMKALQRVEFDAVFAYTWRKALGVEE